MEQNVQPIPTAKLCFLESALCRRRLLSQVSAPAREEIQLTYGTSFQVSST